MAKIEQERVLIDSNVLIDVIHADPVWFDWSDAGFLAGQAFRKYRRKGGIRSTTLPDFFIGAHTLTAGLTLLTRNARRYRSYFPELRLIAPEHG